MATLNVQLITLAGLTPAFAAAGAGGDEFANLGDEYVEIINGSGTNSYTVTFVTPKTVEGVAIADPTVVVGTNSRKKIGPFPPTIFKNSNGRVGMSYVGTPTNQPAVDLTIGVFKQ